MKSILLVLLIAFSSLTVLAQQDPMDALKALDFSKTSLKQVQLQKLSPEDLKLLRGIVFGRHGRVFRDNDIKVYLEEQSWYKPNPEFKNSMLNDIERRNLDLIRIAEAAKHETIQPGDMRYWRDRQIPARKLGKHSSSEWKVLLAEVEAIHGNGSMTSLGCNSILKSAIGIFRATSTTRKSSRQSSARTSRY